MRLASLFVPLSVLLGSSWVGTASAGNYAITPTTVQLDPGRSSTMLTLLNRGAEQLRFQVRAYAWSQSEGGQMELTDTDDLVVYPTLFAVEPGQVRTIRVGTMQGIPGAEISYRLFVEELPPQDEQTGQTGVHVLARMGVPVFLTPDHPTVSGGIASTKLQDGVLKMRVVNDGEVHVKLKDVSVTGLDEDGRTLWELHRQDWYLLSRGARALELELPQTACQQVSSLEVEVVSDRATWSRRVPASGESCQP